MQKRVTGLAILLVLAAAGPACGGQGREREEARSFLGLYEAIDHRAPVAEREQKLAALEQLVLVEPAVKEARDMCVAAHRALIQSEEAHEQAAKRLDQAIAGQPNGEPLEPQVTDSIRKDIAQAEQSLSQAKGKFEQCESLARSLSVRLGKR